MKNVAEIRQQFIDKLASNEFVTDKTGVKCVEIVGESFIADEEAIFGTPNYDYIAREIEWYKSMSRFVDDIPGGPPEIWKKVASVNGQINSNYGWCILSGENGYQYLNVLRELSRNPDSRRAEMIYTRPTMHTDYNFEGMSDFICTDAVSYFIRNNLLYAHVKMRSNDAVFGYKNDWAWQDYILGELASDLSVETGDIIWTASSLHVYERHFHLITK